MEINDELLNRLCRRAGLLLSSEEQTIIKADLKKALSHFEKIREIDTEGAPAAAHPLDIPLRLRDDRPEDFPKKDSLLELAPERQSQLFKGPPIGGKS